MTALGEHLALRLFEPEEASELAAEDELIGHCTTRGCGRDSLRVSARDLVAAASTTHARTARTGYRIGYAGARARCGGCGQLFALVRLQGRRVATVRCSSLCRDARGPSCTCSCGGANHGRNHRAA